MSLEEWYIKLGAKEIILKERCTIYFTDVEWVHGIRTVTIDSKGNIWNAQAVTLEEIYKAVNFVKSYTW